MKTVPLFIENKKSLIFKEKVDVLSKDISFFQYLAEYVCSIRMIISVLFVMGSHSLAYSAPSKYEPERLLKSYGKDILKVNNKSDIKRTYLDIAKTEFGLTKLLFDFAHELSNGVYYKEMKYLVHQKQWEILIKQNNAIMIPRLKQMVGKSYQPAVFTQNLDKYMQGFNYALTGLTLATNIYDVLMGDDTARLKSVTETMKFQMNSLIGKIGSKSLNVAMIGVSFMDYALTEFMKAQHQQYEEYWWNAYSMYLNKKYRKIVTGPDSWASLAIQDNDAVNARLNEFWVYDEYNPLTRAIKYYKKPSPFQQSALAEATFKKPFAARFYNEYLHKTLKTFFQRKAEQASFEFEDNLVASCQELMAVKQDIEALKKALVQAGKEMKEKGGLDDKIAITLSQGDDIDRGKYFKTGLRLLSRKGTVWAVSRVTFPKSEITRKVKVLWRLKDKDQMILSTKMEELEGAGESHEIFIKIPVESLSQGRYSIMLSQSLVENPKETVEARVSFKVYEPVKIRGLWATNKLGSKEEKKVFAPDEIPHLYFTFDMNKELGAVQTNFDFINKRTGKQIYSVPNEYRYSPDKELQVTGIRLPKGLVNPGDYITFIASIMPSSSSPEIFEALTRSIDFSIVSSDLKIRASRVLIGDQAGRYSINVPEGFERPYSVRIAGGGLSVSKSSNPLRGRFRGSISTSDRAYTMTFKVTDARGKTARGKAVVQVRGLDSKTIASKKRSKVKLYSAPPKPSPIAIKRTEGTSTDYKKTLQSITDNYTKEMQSIRNKHQSEMETLERENKAALRKIKQTSTPAWATGQGSARIQNKSKPPARSYPIDVSQCRDAFYNCMGKCPKTGTHKEISSCQAICGNANSACIKARCPDGEAYGVGWNLKCRPY